jgi:hypothetical protein
MSKQYDELVNLLTTGKTLMQEHADRIEELEARMVLAMRLDYANYPGFITSALYGKDIPKDVLEVTTAICTSEEYEPTLRGR